MSIIVKFLYKFCYFGLLMFQSSLQRRLTIEILNRGRCSSSQEELDDLVVAIEAAIVEASVASSVLNIQDLFRLRIFKEELNHSDLTIPASDVKWSLTSGVERSLDLGSSQLDQEIGSLHLTSHGGSMEWSQAIRAVGADHFQCLFLVRHQGHRLPSLERFQLLRPGFKLGLIALNAGAELMMVLISSGSCRFIQDPIHDLDPKILSKQEDVTHIDGFENLR